MSENSKEIGMHQKDARILTDQFYKTKMCPHMTKPEGCLRSMKDNCPYAHSELELRSPPDLVKTAMCKLFLKQSCSKTSSECAYAHQFEELRHTESFYKTFVCKFWTAGYCKAGDLCRYAHGEEELRKINVKEENTGNLNPPQKSAACNEIHYSTDSFETKVTPGYINNVTNNGHCATPPMATYPIYQNYTVVLNITVNTRIKDNTSFLDY
ncbi:hypothetical protein BEWA_019250 [Theileria equi strain WA]|uniref:C3H1-type domain-containing protein n=1 Tax=Theileria equi strain WA TaxID=1537102 RepID=L0AU51_THEEQ|nr:hypothetical protein BEWA_019250 [Theileria equi strain WA]AFZ79080.1 hypothetical protein BEWA_019250 [Theileria equi strain WA]|eukprot:XP_004828746.1 hypothetical protein BEWA_019250 [Theileria equi strain WA]